MAQHDYNIADQPGLAFLADLNSALEAGVTLNSGATAPTTTYAGMLWLDTSTTPPVLKQRNQANDGWDTLSSLLDAEIMPSPTAGGYVKRKSDNTGNETKTAQQVADELAPLFNFPAASDTTAGVVRLASIAEQRAGTALDRAVVTGRQHYHPSAAKAWVNWNCVDASIRRSYNVSSITDNGVGDFTINFSTPFLSADYALAGFANHTNVNPAGLITYNNTFAPQVNSCRIRVANSATAAGVDSSHATVLFFGEM